MVSKPDKSSWNACFDQVALLGPASHKQEKATETVLEQADVLSEAWAVG